ncbi:MAG: hypothetical protein IJN82_05310 [Clostridia bacterium]|nr:hypothetical protein [Clostridia bacterium]
MNRSVIALLLIFILALSGCKAQQEAGSATPAERVELDAEVEQKEPLIVPNESDPEEEQPAEEEPGQPTEDQKNPEEQPAEKEEPEKEDPEIVKFWETVPEMTIDEAKVIVKAKFERIKSEEKLGTLTDEERMALYVLNCNYYDALHQKDEFRKKLFPRETDQVVYEIQIDSAFTGDVEEYFQKYSWENEPFAEEHLDERFTKYNRIYPRSGGTMIFGESFVHYDVFDMGYDFGDELNIVHSPDGIRIYIYRTQEQSVGDAEPVTELYRNILRHYLSLKPVAFLEGPRYFYEFSVW